MELAKEMKADLVKGLSNDCARMQEKLQALYQGNVYDRLPSYTTYDIDNLVYITEEMRLKLKLLGGARIYEL